MSKKLGFYGLASLVVGSMIGSGIFSIPQNLAAVAAPGPLFFGWIITGVGIIALARVFQILAARKQGLDGGIYSYARHGFGHYMGFNSAWGYWISAWLGNVSYIVLLASSLSILGISSFGDGNTLTALVFESVFLWVLTWICLSGIKEAVNWNVVITIAKVVPVAVFLLILFFAFDSGLFTTDFWGHARNSGENAIGSTFAQVRNMMLITTWSFVGVEGASLYSARAENRKHVGSATIVGLLFVLLCTMLVSFLSMGAVPQEVLANMQNPSMAGVLEAVVGHWGSILISIGVVISLMGALLSWTLLPTEIMYVAALDKATPSFMLKENSKGVPFASLLLTNGCIQAFLIIAFIFHLNYMDLLLGATSMILIPYFFSSAYGFLVAVRGESDVPVISPKKDLFLGLLATVYGVWLIYAAGLKYVYLNAIFFMLGIAFYIWAKKEDNRSIFTPIEAVFAVIIGVAGIAALVQLYNGTISF